MITFLLLIYPIILRVCGEENTVRECKEMSGSTLDSLVSSWVALGREGSSTSGTVTSSSGKYLEMSIKGFVPYTCARENIFHHNFRKYTSVGIQPFHP
jgi:hypothetical protein